MIRELEENDFEKFWPVFKSIIQAQETYAFDPKMNYEEGFHLWCQVPQQTFVVEENNQILGSYYIKANAAGPGDHICNCGYMVDPVAGGKGIARKMCEHSQQIARQSGFKAMQFNSIVSTNQIAVALWQKLGFNIIGTIPEAYRHPKYGFVDCYIMYKSL